MCVYNPARTCVCDLPHREDALEAAYDEMLDRQGLRRLDAGLGRGQGRHDACVHPRPSKTRIKPHLRLVDRKCIRGDHAQLQHNRLPTNRQVLLPSADIHVVDVRHHLPLGQRGLLDSGKKLVGSPATKEGKINRTPDRIANTHGADTTSAHPVTAPPCRTAPANPDNMQAAPFSSIRSRPGATAAGAPECHWRTAGEQVALPLCETEMGRRAKKLT